MSCLKVCAFNHIASGLSVPGIMTLHYSHLEASGRIVLHQVSFTCKFLGVETLDASVVFLFPRVDVK
jgi:hypothetical protein